MNLNDDVVYRCLRLGPLHQLYPAVRAARSVTTIAFIVHLLVRPFRPRNGDLPFAFPGAPLLAFHGTSTGWLAPRDRYAQVCAGGKARADCSSIDQRGGKRRAG